MLSSNLKDELRRRAYLLEIELCLTIGKDELARELIRALAQVHKCWATASDEEQEVLRFLKGRIEPCPIQAELKLNVSLLSMLCHLYALRFIQAPFHWMLREVEYFTQQRDVERIRMAIGKLSEAYGSYGVRE